MLKNALPIGIVARILFIPIGFAILVGVACLTDDSEDVANPFPAFNPAIVSSNQSLKITWIDPPNITGIYIVKNSYHAPHSRTDGTMVQIPAGIQEWIDSDVTINTPVYYAIYTYLNVEDTYYYSNMTYLKGIPLVCDSVDVEHLNVGQFHYLCLEDQTVEMQLMDTSAGEEYVFVLYNLPDWLVANSYEGTNGGSFLLTTETQGASDPAPTARLAAPSLVPSTRLQFDRMRYETSVDRLLKNETQITSSRVFPSTIATGDIIDEIYVFNPNHSNYTAISAEVVRMSERAVFLLDIMNPPNSTDLIGNDLTNALTDMEIYLDSLIVTMETSLIGNFPIINGQDKLFILLSSLFSVPDSWFIGYFSNPDFFERSETNDVSNEAAIIYSARPGYYSLHEIGATIAHEFQHLLNFNAGVFESWRLKTNGLGYTDAYVPDSDQYYNLDEGLAYLMEDLTGFSDTTLGPAFVTQEFLGSKANNNEKSFVNRNMEVPIITRGLFYLLLRYSVEQLGGIALYSDGNVISNEATSFIQTIIKNKSYRWNQFVDAYLAYNTDGRDIGLFIGDFLTAIVNDGLDNQFNTDPLYNFNPTTEHPYTLSTQGIDLTSVRLPNESDDDRIELTGPNYLEWDALTYEGAMYGGSMNFVRYRVPNDPPKTIHMSLTLSQSSGTNYARLFHLK